MGWPTRSQGSQVGLEQADETLKNYRFARGSVRREIEEFFSRLPEPYRSFAKYRYEENQPMTMEVIAEKLGYSTRTMYVFRKKVLHWWILYSTGDVESLHKGFIVQEESG
ncbi:MAG TPA: hypothetical protein GXX39_02340 [Syntrophothermus lipocalidus]|uniref:Uncharacterized protein n=1 Tax=Syntrophothermus lipocalidus (strain DSM 12680 / TGB-C1) TaxID=643648 RepID=D7CPD8_SYNLT|nr:hypothetical protein [Syntrophothermus lipocalidus]ADI02573.1 hypothetical protein Slip_1818 [Syntrophothermus lipocalidus DSM 12680]HHV76197.1 hypothetical protein [Syntrophothermus lipocalidus]